MQTSFFIHRYFRDAHQLGEETNLEDENLQLFLVESRFIILSDREKIKRVENHGFELLKRELMRSHIVIKRVRDKFYLLIHHPRFNIILQDQEIAPFPWKIILSYLSLLLFLVGLYLWIIRSLKPLKTLQQQIQKVTEGDLSISVRSSKKDEIAEVANAFDDALRKLESLINSRQLFLRTIMHELKTPIAKGKLLNTFLEDEDLEERYEMVFDRLQLLIEEFSKIEQMLSSNYRLKIANYSAIDIVEQALELMILDENELEESVEIIHSYPLMIETDFELLALALKNLIDNGIKYSSDGFVRIDIGENNIKILNRGERLNDDLSLYQQPFKSSSNGLGLGLYIVSNITKILGSTLLYDYTKGWNQFELRLKPPPSTPNSPHN